MKAPTWWSVLAASYLLSACVAQKDYVWFSEVPTARAGSALAVGDRIAVSVDQQPELSGEFEIGAAGTYNQPLAGAIEVGGKDVSAAGMFIASKLSRYVQAPTVKVTLVSRRPLAMPVLGEVRTPGTYTVPHGSSVLAVLAAAGGLSEFADEDEIFVLRSSPAPLRIRFRYLDLVTPSIGANRFALQDGDTVVVE